MAEETLRIVKGNAAGTQISVGGELLIGRSAEGEGRLGEDPEISRQHARITRTPQGLQIEDLGSTNGTFVNGKRISTPQQLNPGDTIDMGTTTLQLADAAGRSPQVTAVTAQPVPPPPAPTAQPPQAQPPAPPPQAQPPQAPPPGPPPAPVPAPAAGPPGGAPPPGGPPGRKGRSGPPVPLIAGLGVLLIALIVGGIVLLGGGGDDDSEESSASENLSTNKAATVVINTRGPARDEQGNEAVSAGGGTGIVINARKGHVLTNAHVLAGQTSIKATVKGNEVNAQVLGTAPCEDLAVVKLSPVPTGLKNAKLGRARTARSGSRVTALGFPGAFEKDVTERRLQTNSGTVSSDVGPATLGETLPKLPAVIQHQAPINAGNSGGPLLNRNNEVVGVNTFAAAAEGGAQNQNGAISIDRARSLMKSLAAGENLAYVGWDLIPGKTDQGTEYLFVQGVDADSPGERAKLTFGDYILRVDGTRVASVPDVCDILGSKGPGDSVRVNGVTTVGSRAFEFTQTVKLR